MWEGMVTLLSFYYGRSMALSNNLLLYFAYASDTFVEVLWAFALDDHWKRRIILIFIVIS